MVFFLSFSLASDWRKIPGRQADDHIRNLKTALKNTFTGGASGLSGAVTASHTELNVLDGIPATLTATELGYVDGVTSAIQTQIDAKAVGIGNWVQIGSTAEITGTPSAVDFIHGTGGVVIDSTYDQYMVTLSAVLPSTSGATLWMRTTTNAPSFDSSGYAYAITTVASDSSTNPTVLVSASTTNIGLFQTASNAAGAGVSGHVTFFKPSAADRFEIGLTTFGLSTSFSTLLHCSGAGANTAAANVDGIRFMFSTGTMASGTIKLFGRRIT